MTQIYPPDLNAVAAIAQFTPKIVTALPYVLKPEDRGKELIFSGLAGQVTVPDDVSQFSADYQVLISQDLPGEIFIDREDGIATDLIFTRGNQYLRQIGEVAIRRRGTSNIFKITGLLEA